jgi:hypothetical protein
MGVIDKNIILPRVKRKNALCWRRRRRRRKSERWEGELNIYLLSNVKIIKIFRKLTY